jgi:hypothetical protein
MGLRVVMASVMATLRSMVRPVRLVALGVMPVLVAPVARVVVVRAPRVLMAPPVLVVMVVLVVGVLMVSMAAWVRLMALLVAMVVLGAVVVWVV